jgi:hypothetical protein
MQAGLTKAAIEAYADALIRDGANDPAARLKRLAGLFYGFASRPLGELLTTMDDVASARLCSENLHPENIGVAIASLSNLELLVQKISSRNRLRDLVAFRARLERHESANIDELVKAVQFLRRGGGDGGTVQSDSYKFLADKLKAALGRDDQFNPVFQELEALDADGVARVTDALMTSGSSKSRKKDLDRIRERHEAQRALLAKRRAMRGRSAA